jgi:hypothetical protein
MNRDATHISLDEFIENCVKVGLTANEALRRARGFGYRIRTGEFYRRYRDAERQWAA